MRIASIAAYAPRYKVTNNRISARLRLERMRVNANNRKNELPQLSATENKQYKTSDRWIRHFIGFKERRFAAPEEGTIDLAARAALLILGKTDLKASDIDGIVFGTVTPSYLNSPPDSALLQDRLGIPPTNNGSLREFHCFDCSLACSTWVASLKQAYLLISSGLAKNVLVVGADKMSETINWRDRAFATILGDAGTATWCTAVDPEQDWFAPERFWNWANGRDSDIILTPKGGSKHPVESVEDITEFRNRLSMDGAMVKDIIVPIVGGPALEAALEKAGWTIDSLDLATLHEANLMLNRKIASSWKEKGFTGQLLDAGGMFGNTTSATIPLALTLNGDQLKKGQRFIWSAFGGGLTVSTVLGEIKHDIQTFRAI